MGTDIHLRVERRRKKPEQIEWEMVPFNGDFSCRIYGMFSRMAGVRESSNYTHKVKFAPRGIPDDISYEALNTFCYRTTTDKEYACCVEHRCLIETAEEYIRGGLSKWVKKEHGMLTNPDYHSYSWLTAKELRQCYDDCFFDENGKIIPFSDYIDWLGLVSLCEGIESTGDYECRVVFAFDN